MSTVPNGPAASEKLDGGVLKIAGVVVLGLVMSILDITVVSVALPTFTTEFNTSLATAAWTMTGYTLALATVIPITGWAADRFGTKRLYMLALVLFLGGSVLCSFAWDINSLIGFRVVQGLGGGMLMPLGMTIMTRAAGPARVGRVMAVLGVPMLLGPIGGPILGGWLIEEVSWHWIFLINVPLGIVALIFAAIVLPKDEPHPSESFDFVGMLLMSPGLALFLFGVSSIPEEGTVAAARVLIPAAIGLVLIIAFIWHAFRPRHPLVDLRLFKNKQLTVATVTMFLFGIAFFGAMLLIPTYFLQVRGESTLHAGLLVAPQGLGAMITMPIAGRLVDKIGPGKIVLAGMVLILGGMGVLTQIESTTPYPVLLGALFVMGLGMGATMMPTMTAAMQTLTDHMIARGSTLLNIVQQIASSIGSAIMSVVLTNQITSSMLAGPAIAAQHDPAVAAQLPPGAKEQGLAEAAEGFGATFVLAFVLIVATMVAAFFLPKKKAPAPTGEAGEERAPVMVH
ncbi:DHA2 family efflux MFS transporter permease subunit [Phytomonospora endophytica]|uniref:EmrB/QacA subfamily drug resistance transporter n=1 Tax=Phytomonospora endophytica TaxID=714109 RepID=A0A841FLE7_9ACTN|nr:DHA2 family efflux MFS transporter permease subunit [Phytomonospora endophytica]MBB6034007.1 EmrB/QacA subfamily drug resistance transporter [Phytomonospora endophytica]GIG64472.1 multidrug resistance protein B [Phytomonospora endophytica]